MLIKLVSPAAATPIFFSIAFSNLPLNLQIPPAWTNQIAILNLDDLELPNVLHALDKSAATTALLLEVSFDTASQTVSCVFVDGSREQWSFLGSRCLEALDAVVHTVNAAAAESERERERQLAEDRWREYDRERLLNMTIPPPVTLKYPRHKKQRSLLMTLVSSFVPSVRPSPPQPSHPPLPPPSPPPHLSSSSLRVKARSILVDVYRRYVITELTRRSLPGTYYTWVIKSMLRRISDNLDELVREAGGTLPDHVPINQHSLDAIDYLPALVPPSPSPSPSPPPSSIDEESEDTDTDGSSLHTPSTSTSSYTPNTSNASVASRLVSSGPRPESPTERTASEQQCMLSPEALETYTELSEHAVRLRNLLMLAGAKDAHDAREACAREAVLEVRCRRRAWLSRRLTVCGMGGVDFGMAAPFERSPLGMRGWTAADVEEDEDDVDDEEEECGEFVGSWNGRCMGYPSRGSLLRQRLGLGESRLFPVSEEEEEDGFEDDEGSLIAREMALDMEFEFEVGSDWVRADRDDGLDPTPLDLVLMERPKARPRMRVRSNSMHMHMRRRHLESVDLPPLAPSALLFAPMKGCHGVPDVGDVSFLDHEEEFTLAMDLPRRRTMKGGDVEREEVHERMWMSPVPVVDCR